MKARIDENICTGCGLCCDNCPEVFEMGDTTANVIADPVPSEYEEKVREAAENCPVDAISIE